MEQYFEAIERAAQKLGSNFSNENVLKETNELNPNDFNYLFQKEKLVKTYYLENNLPFIKIYLKALDDRKIFSIVVDGLTFDYDIEKNKKELSLILRYLKNENKLPSIEDFDNLFHFSLAVSTYLVYD